MSTLPVRCFLFVALRFSLRLFLALHWVSLWPSIGLDSTFSRPSLASHLGLTYLSLGLHLPLSWALLCAQLLLTLPSLGLHSLLIDEYPNSLIDDG